MEVCFLCPAAIHSLSLPTLHHVVRFYIIMLTLCTLFICFLSILLNLRFLSYRNYFISNSLSSLLFINALHPFNEPGCFPPY